MTTDDNLRKKLEIQAEEVGCWGLMDGIAYNVKTHKMFSANTAIKDDGPFYCKECLSDAVIHKCTEKRDHFAHKARLSPVVPRGESELHGNCKYTLRDLLAERFPDGKWAVERTIPKNHNLKVRKLIPDVSGRINGTRVAIEVQASDLTVKKIAERTESYAKRDISLLWLVPLTKNLGNRPFRPRQFERYFHSIYYGRIYYWWADLGLSLMPVHFGVAKRYIEPTEKYEDGELIQFGGYDKPYKIIKTPIYGPKLDIVEHFRSRERLKFTPENERKSVPACKIWMDDKSPWWLKNEDWGNNS